MYVATRGLYSLKPPTVFVPPCIKESVEKMLDIHQEMGQVELNLDLVALDVGMYSRSLKTLCVLNLCLDFFDFNQTFYLQN